MNEVDMTRSFIETIKENITQCKETQATWETRDQAFTWLVDNVEKATDKEIEWDQKFEQGSSKFSVKGKIIEMNLHLRRSTRCVNEKFRSYENQS